MTANTAISRNFAGAFTRLIVAASLAIARDHTRRALDSLSDRQLDDMGIDRSLVRTGPAADVDAATIDNLMSLR